MLYVDIPTSQEVVRLNAHRASACASLYVPTTPVTQHADISRIELGHLWTDAFSQMQEAGVDKQQTGAMQELLETIFLDDGFWAYQANSLAVLVTPEELHTFRLPNRLQASVEVSDRFHLKPLLRAVTFPHTAFVLALSENAARLIEIFPDLAPQRIDLPGLTGTAAEALGKPTLNSRSHDGRIHGAEGQKVRLAQYARLVDAAIRPVLAGRDLPLILAASQPLASIYRQVNSYPHLLDEGILHIDDRTTEAEIAAEARPLLDRHYGRELEAFTSRFEDKMGSKRASTELADIARAATLGAIEALAVDIDAQVPGVIDEESGALTLAEEPSAKDYDVIDEIAGRALRTAARVLAVRRQDIPGPGNAAAILRYPAWDGGRAS